MVHFTGEGATNQQMYLSHSTDGLHWNDLNGAGVPVGAGQFVTRKVASLRPVAVVIGSRRSW